MNEPDELLRVEDIKTYFYTEDGIVKAIRGITTLDEVLRVTQRDMVSESFAAPKKAEPGAAPAAKPK
mgnify:CR=1 FL=1